MSQLREWHLWRAPVGDHDLKNFLMLPHGHLDIYQVTTAIPKYLYGGLSILVMHRLIGKTSEIGNIFTTLAIGKILADFWQTIIDAILII